MPTIRPIIVLGVPRSGTTLLYSMLSSHPELWSFYQESEALLREVLGAAPFEQGDALDAGEFEPAALEQVRRQIYRCCFNEQRLLPNRASLAHTPGLARRASRRLLAAVTAPFKPETIRFVDKNPRYCLRVEWLQRLWPDAHYVFIRRDPRSNISSLIEGWRSQRHSSFTPAEPPQIAGYTGRHWHYLRPPGWQEFTRGASLAEVCAFQYGRANEAALDGLESVPQQRRRQLSYEDLIAEPVARVSELCDWLELKFAGGLSRFARELPPVNTLEAPDPHRWEKNRPEIERVLPSVAEVAARLGYDAG